jgi:Sulfatase
VGAAAGGLTRRAVAVALSILFLNASLTFVNVWPTPAIRWRGELSIELAAALLLIAIVTRRRVRPAANAAEAPRERAEPDVRLLSVVWTVLVLGRYAETTAPALYGRDVNLYWDLRLIPDVAAMAARVAPLWVLVASAAAAASMLAILYFLVRSAWRSIVAAMHESVIEDCPFLDRGPEDIGSADRARVIQSAFRTPPSALTLRRLLIAASAAALIAAATQRLSGRAAGDGLFPSPVSLTYARQIQFVLDAIYASSPVANGPAIDSDLSQVRGADVLLVFVESYGAVSFERPQIAQALRPARARLDAAVHAGHRDIASAYVESPTFGGSSWLAHLSLMSGVEVRDPRTNARLMTERRDTLVRLFSRRGYRTVAIMPGLRQRWPEGVFYGFDEIYGADRLAYRGPQFGWFAIPDQYSLDRLDALELRRPGRRPVFAFFPTLTTHFPFNPTPPYQPDWRRIASDRPFDGPAIVRAYGREPDWMNFTPGYIDAMSYELETFAGYLEKNADRDFVMILVGDHQPPALVTGEGATWNVPVHVITSRAPVLERLLARGFRRGLAPEGRAIARMHALLPILLETLGDHE